MTLITPSHPSVPASVYAGRRSRLAKQMGTGSLAIIPTAPVQLRNRDCDFLYRPDSYFYYLCGFSEPDACLVVGGEGHSTLFCQPLDAAQEVWNGFRLGPAAAPAMLGVEAAFATSEMDAKLPDMLDGKDTVCYPFATHKGLETRVDGWLGQLRAKVRQGTLPPQHLGDLCGFLDAMRLIKDPHELSIMRHAAQISAAGHIRAMRLTARKLQAGQDLHEYHLDAELLHEFRHHGAQAQAYGSIVASGGNACVLHYRAGARQVNAGELVLIDAACELDGYASDITRTYPVNGRFSGPQRCLYALVLAAQQAAIASTRPGARLDDLHDAAVRVLAQGLLDLHILDANTVGGIEDVIDKKAYARFYMHRTSHWIGMDVHDCGSYVEPSERHIFSLRQDALTGQRVKHRPSCILRPGMALTIEPGVYVRAADDVPVAFHNIGIRIEDVAIVTDTGCELITRDVPVGIREIEALMHEAKGINR